MAIADQREETAQCLADHRPTADWIDGTDSLRDSHLPNIS